MERKGQLTAADFLAQPRAAVRQGIKQRRGAGATSSDTPPEGGGARRQPASHRHTRLSRRKGEENPWRGKDS
jgi:hypothetical protein